MKTSKAFLKLAEVADRNPQFGFRYITFMAGLTYEVQDKMDEYIKFMAPPVFAPMLAPEYDPGKVRVLVYLFAAELAKDKGD